MYGFLLGIPLLAAGIFFYNQMPVISEPEDQERPVEEPVAEAPEPEPEEPAEERPEPEPEEPGSVLLAFAGDVMFSDPFGLYDKSGISAIADSEMLEHMQNADLFVINEEFPFSLRGKPWKTNSLPSGLILNM